MSVISKKHQITIPVDALREAELAAGDDVRVVAVGPGRIELVRTDALVDRFAGIFDQRVYPEGYLEDVRAAWR